MGCHTRVPPSTWKGLLTFYNSFSMSFSQAWPGTYLRPLLALHFLNKMLKFLNKLWTLLKLNGYFWYQKPQLLFLNVLPILHYKLNILRYETSKRWTLFGHIYGKRRPRYNKTRGVTPKNTWRVCAATLTPIFKPPVTEWPPSLRNKCLHWRTPIFTNKWPPLDKYPIFVWEGFI